MIARKTGISKTRISELCNNPSAQLKVKELCVIALAMEVEPGELLHWVCRHLNQDVNGKLDSSQVL